MPHILGRQLECPAFTWGAGVDLVKPDAAAPQQYLEALRAPIEALAVSCHEGGTAAHLIPTFNSVYLFPPDAPEARGHPNVTNSTGHDRAPAPARRLLQPNPFLQPCALVRIK